MMLLIPLWAMGDIILGVIWLVTNRKKGRDCPACGNTVKKGLFICKSCGQLPDRCGSPGTAPAEPGRFLSFS